MELELKKTAAFFIICLSSSALMSCVSTQENQKKTRSPKESQIVNRAKTSSLLQQSLETLISGESLTGKINNNHQIRITPLKTWKSESGHYCRSYKEEILSKAKTRTRKKGIACRETDGRWKKVAQKSSF